MEKLLYRFDFSWQAHSLEHELTLKNIKSKITFRPREYSAIIVGGSNDAAEIYVAEADFQSAQEILKDYLARNAAVQSDTEPGVEKNYFNRVVIFSLLGIIILPIIFNFAALANYIRLKKQSKPNGSKKIALLILVLGWLIGAAEIYTVISAFLPDDAKQNVMTDETRACLESINTIPPGDALLPSEKNPLNGVWKLVGIECRGGTLTQQNETWQQDIQNGKYVGTKRIADQWVFSKALMSNVPGHGACNMCTREVWRVEHGVIAIQYTFIGTQDMRGQTCEPERELPTELWTYELDGSKLSILLKKNNKNCNSGDFVKHYVLVNN